VNVQSKAIGAHLLPSNYLNTLGTGVFYPYFLFYGGSLYAIAGALGALSGGHYIFGFVAVTFLAVLAAYGGLVWLARQVGSRTWMAHAPAITYVASAYYVTNLYGRGAWPEFIASSVIPLLVAAGWRLASSDRVEPGTAALFVVATVVFAGSHNATLLIGSLFVLIGYLVLLAALGRAVHPCSGRRLVAIASLAALGLAIDAWYLIPDVRHASDTLIGDGQIYPWRRTGFLSRPGVLFNPLRSVPAASSTPALYVQLPDWLLAWALVVGAAGWAAMGRRMQRAAIGVLGLLIAVLLAMSSAAVWDHLPDTLRRVQFSYRLNTYFVLAAAALVLIAVIGLERRRGVHSGYRLALLGASAVTAGLCLWQLWVPNTRISSSYPDRRELPQSAHVLPHSWYATQDYRDGSGPLIMATQAAVTFDPFSVNSNAHAYRAALPPGALVRTNIAAGPSTAHLSGATRAGRTPDGLEVIRGGASAGTSTTVRLSADVRDLVIARVISGLALLVACGLILNTGRRAVKRRKLAGATDAIAAPARRG
ncbi:MAG TPA: hypothetical protein VGH45_05630, partial [Solirubrobacteraceae bacterium]